MSVPQQPVNDGSIVILMQPADQYGFNGESVVLAVGAENVKDYQWQYFDGEEWKDSVMQQANLPAMQLVVFPAGTPRMYRCKLTGLDNNVVYTNEVCIAEQ